MAIKLFEFKVEHFGDEEIKIEFWFIKHWTL